MQPRPVTITPVLNGYIVQIGCQSLVFNSFELLEVELLRYFKNPTEVEHSYKVNAVNPSCLTSEPANREIRDVRLEPVRGVDTGRAYPSQAR